MPWCGSDYSHARMKAHRKQRQREQEQLLWLPFAIPAAGFLLVGGIMGLAQLF